MKTPEQWLELLHQISPTSQHSIAGTLDFVKAIQQDAIPQWQPIESAPKDGTLILAYSSERCALCKEDSTGISAVLWDGNWILVEDDNGGAITLRHAPTHWQPLPPPPTEKGGGE